MASWTGTTPYATKKQLVSSISGLYNDIQDIELSSVTIADLKVSTLTAANWISTPVLYTSTIQANNIDVSTLTAQFLSSTYMNVSTIHADNLDVSGLLIDQSGVLFALNISSIKGEFNVVLLSTLNFKLAELDLDVDVNVDIHIGEAFSGFLLGLGGLLFETLLGIGAGAGLAFQGIGNGLAAMIWGRGGNTTYINNNVFELLSGTTQLQVSTLGNAYPLYSTITRFVSSPVANGVPGAETFLSSFFQPGTTCVRSISDPFPLVTQNSNINTSTIQSFGQWVPILGNDYFLNFSTMNGDLLRVSTLQFLNGFANNLSLSTINTNNININYSSQPGIFMSNRASYTINNAGDYPGSGPFDYQVSTLTERAYYANRFQISSIYPSTFVQGISTFGPTTAANPADITGPPVLANFTQLYQQPGLPNTFVTAWNVSTATYDVYNSGSGALQILIPPTLTSNDFINNNRVLVLPNQNRRVSWNIDPANNTGVSSVTTIPPPIPTIVNTNFITEMIHERDPYEDVYSYYLTQSPQLGNVAFNVSTMAFGSNTTRTNGEYPFTFWGDTNVHGTLECDTLIVLSSIVAISTIIEVESVLSTANVISDDATITNGLFNRLSTNSLKTSTMSAFDTATFLSNVNITGFTSAAGNLGAPTVQLRYNPSATQSNFGNLTTDGQGGVIISDWYNFIPENIILESVRNATNDGYDSFINISTLNVNTISTSSHTGENITANFVTVNSNLTFQTPQYTSFFDPADISKTTTLTSTSFGAVSSLTNNILNYTLTVDIPDQTIFNLSASNTSGMGIDYRMGPTNVEQWGSTILLFDEYQNPGDILLPVSTAMAGLTGTFDVQVALAQGQQYVNSFYVSQLNGLPPGPNPGQNMSTFLFVDNPESGGPGVPFTGTWRFTIGSSGWIESVQPNPSPYATVNSNLLLVNQTLTDVGVYTTDRLLIYAGDTLVNGNLQTSNFATNDITCGFINVPSVTNNQNVIQMQFSNTSSSNNYNLLYGSIKEGASFPQLSNYFSLNMTSSNASINARENIEFITANGDTVLLAGSIQNLEMASGTVKANNVTYGNTGSGFLQPRAFRQQTSQGLGTGQSFSVNVQVKDSGNNTFLGANYNLMTCLASFACTSDILAFGTVILAPYIDSNDNTWYVNVAATVNAGAAGADATISWNNLLFPYNMMT